MCEKIINYMIMTVIGESGSGKSEYAENILINLANSNNTANEKKYYIATMQPYGADAKKRILRHHKLRENKGFSTIERYFDIGNCEIESGSNVLIECISNLTANEMFDISYSDGEDICKCVYEKICKGIYKLAEISENLVIVTNDIFCDGIIYDESTMSYIRLLGRINRYLANISDKVAEVVYSCPVIIK